MVPCLVPRPQYFAVVNRFRSRDPGRKRGQVQKNNNKKLRQLIRLRAAEGNSLGISVTATALEKQLKPFAFVLLTGQVMFLFVSEQKNNCGF